MSPRPVVAVFAILLAANLAGADALEVTSSVHADAPLQVAPYGDGAWITTAVDGRQVRWTAEAGLRDVYQVSWAQPPVGLETWGDSVVVHFDGADSRLIYHLPGGYLIDSPRQAGWHLPNAVIDEQMYRVFIDPQIYLLIYSAPGAGSIVSLFDFLPALGPQDLAAHQGSLALLAGDQGMHVVGLEQPLVPYLASSVEPPQDGWTPRAVAVHGRYAHVIWGDVVQTYGLDNLVAPELRGEAPCDLGGLVASENWLVAFTPGEYRLQAFAVDDAGSLSQVGEYVTEFPIAGPVQIHGDHIVVQDPTGVRAYRMARPSTLEDDGVAWTLLPAERMVAHRGWVWFQGNLRRTGLAYLGAPELSVNTVPGELVDLGLADDILVTGLRQAVRLDLLPALDAEPTTVLTPAAPLLALDTDGRRLVLATEVDFELVDLDETATPITTASVALPGTAAAVAVHDHVAVVALRPVEGPDFVQCINLVEPLSPLLEAAVPARFNGHDWRLISTVQLGSVAHFLCRRDDGELTVVRDLAVGMIDPTDPFVSWSEVDPDLWCYDADGQPVGTVRPVVVGPLRVAFRGTAVTIYDDATALATWQAPGAVTAMAAIGNRVMVATDNRIDLLTYSDGDLVAVPSTAVAGAVLAVPNPFNPRTEITFAMPTEGRARVLVHDLRGRVVRTLEETCGAGTARLSWNGANDEGRALPSGQYLLRVTTPAGTTTGRCTLLR